ncbi:MAG TPA: hypothetical protein VMX17_15950 [Candidatus Glassbacteria bacterium]|nr:hypothetical protein [Candidatus Glassbacteria bacterium]
MKNYFTIFLFVILFSIGNFSNTTRTYAQEEIGQEKAEKQPVEKEITRTMKKVYIGGKVGWVNHMESTSGNSESTGGLGFGGWLDIHSSKYIKTREQFVFNSFSQTETMIDSYGYLWNVNANLRDMSFSSYLLFMIPFGEVGGNVYLGGGIGLHFMNIHGKLTSDYWSIEDSKSSTNLGFDILVGSTFPIGNVSIITESGYNIVNVPDDWYDTYNELLIMGGLEF